MDNIKNAHKAVQELQKGCLLASMTYNLPFTILRRRASRNIDWKRSYLSGFETTFVNELEQEIILYLKKRKPFFV